MGDPLPDFDDWVRARGAALLRFGYLVTHDRQRAEEAVQDALVALYPRWGRVNADGDPERYVRRSIVNADITRWRRFRRRETPVADPIALRHQYPDDADEVVEQDAAWRLCATLPPRQRAAVVLRYYEGMADAEIAAVLGCSAGTVRSQIHRALAALRQRLASTEEVSRS